MSSLFFSFAQVQQNLSKSFDRLLPVGIPGGWEPGFPSTTRLDPYLRHGSVVYDVGGGKNPVVSLGVKRRLSLRLVGLDIDRDELAASPSGVYDETICGDITQYRGRGDADLVVCQALLEHVRDSPAAITAIASILKPGGTALIFLPSRNAVFARLNLLLPQTWKRKILHTVFPSTIRDQGFPGILRPLHARGFSPSGRG